MRRLLSAAVLAVLVAGGAEAINRPPRSPGVETRDVGPTIPSKVVEKQVTKLTQKVHWLSSLDEARAEAQKQKKPIFWLHALGDLDGIC